MWIVIENGEIFEGDENHFADCFFTNVSEETVRGWCAGHGWKVEIREKKGDV